MAEVILMPRLSDTMTEGVIAAWHKNVGETVKKGDLLAEIETDKATMELESYQEGVLLHIGAQNGEKLQVNDLLAIIGRLGEDVSSLVAQHTSGASAPQQEAPKDQPAQQQPIPQESQQPAAATAPVPDVSAMDEVVLMPRLSDTMTEGVIAAWHKKVGDAVNKGDILAEIETDKATMDLESYKNGTLLYIGAKEGEKILVNGLLAIIGDPSKVNVEQLVAAVNGGALAQGSAAAPQPAAASNAPAPASAPASQPAPEVVNEGRVLASPLAKKVAGEKGVDLKYIKGSGDHGRIIKRDIENYTPAAAPAVADSRPQPQQAASSSPAASAPAPVQAPAIDRSKESYDEVNVSQMRKTIARRLAESKFTAPHFYLTMSIDMDAATTARVRMNELSKVKISFNDMVIKAVAIALKQHPKVNSSWLGEKIRINHHVNVGVAVAVEEGLLVPVVRYASEKTLSQIAVEVKDFAQRAKDKKLQPTDWEGSTFTVSNLGMFGIDQFTAIINPPDSCILAIGAINKVPVVKNNEVVVGNVMKVTLSCDHRVVDGATGSAFLQTVKDLLEEPMRMLI